LNTLVRELATINISQFDLLDPKVKISSHPDQSIQEHHHADDPLPGLETSFPPAHTGTSKRRQTPHAISELWMRSDDDHDREWDHFLQFAAFCIARNEVTVYLEEIRPSELGRVCDGDLGVVGRPLVRYCE